MIPKGPVKKTTISPIVEPVIAALLPPNFFVMKTGRKLSITETKTANIPAITNPKIDISQYSEKKARSNPSHAKGAPGKTGTKVPINPISKRIPARIAKIKDTFIAHSQKTYKRIIKCIKKKTNRKERNLPPAVYFQQSISNCLPQSATNTLEYNFS